MSVEDLPYSDATLALAAKLAEPSMRRHHRNKRAWGSKYAMYVLSKVAEWMVCDSLGLPRNERPEDYRRTDVLVGSTRLGVRFNTRTSNADLLAPADQSTDLDWLVLVHALPGRQAMRIFGVATQQQVIDADIVDLGFDPTRLIPASELRPWTELRDQLLEECCV
jgi:hypothetical protein